MQHTEYSVGFVESGSGPSVTLEWAVLDGNGHLVFKGSHEECEDWLDLHENCARESRSTRSGRRIIRRAYIEFRHMLGWLRQCMSKRVVTSSNVGRPGTARDDHCPGQPAGAVEEARSELATFLRSEGGHSNPSHVVLASIVAGVVFAFAATTSLNIASTMVAINRPFSQGGLVCSGSGCVRNCQQPSCDGDTPDIACALATPQPWDEEP